MAMDLVSDFNESVLNLQFLVYIISVSARAIWLLYFFPFSDSNAA